MTETKRAGGVVLVWYRLDLRLADQPALTAAVRHGGVVIPVYVWDPEGESPWAPGAATRWWLYHSLAALAGSLRERGSRLVVRQGPALEVLQALVQETGATAVYWNRRYEPAVTTRDGRIKEALRGAGIAAESFNGSLLNEPWTVQNQGGKPFQVFTPYWRSCLATLKPDPVVAAPGSLRAPARWPRSDAIEALGLLPKVGWDEGFRSAWRPGEAGAREQLERFATRSILDYGAERDRPDRAGTSRLSAHLHFGEVSPGQVWHAARRAAERGGIAEAEWRRWQFLAELGWREFAYHLLYHFPQTPEHPLRSAFERFPWRTDAEMSLAWRKGRTGYPLVDAGMRELWATGWMHNRVRMVVGSFLVKNLLLSWREGAEWFWDTLVDADLASNTLGWQWVGGCGADAAPYFRIFNPVSQGRKFDPEGEYVRRWVPELQRLPAEHVHAPWEAPADVLRSAGVILGQNYPQPIVSLAASRIHALAAFEKTKTV